MLLYQSSDASEDASSLKSTKVDEIKSAYGLGILSLTENAERVKDQFSDILKTSITIDESFASIVKQMGKGVEYTGGVKKNLAEGSLEVVKLGGSLESALKLQQGLLDSTNKNLILNKDYYRELFAVQQVTGQLIEELNTSFMDSGMSMKDISDEMYKVVETSQKLGINAKVVSSYVQSNLDKLNRYGFENGIDGLTRMAAKAAGLRVDLSTTFGIAENLLDPEKSIELAASLQRLGVASSELTDPLRLMSYAQNDVEGLQNQLGGLFKSYVLFNEETKKFEVSAQGRLMFREYQKEFNIPIEQIEKLAFGTAKLDRALNEIDFSSFGSNLPEDTKEAIANMAQMNKEGKYEIVTKKGDTKLVDDLLNEFSGNSEELQNYISEISSMEGETPQDKLVNLAEQQLGKTGEMIAILNAMKLAAGLSQADNENFNKLFADQVQFGKKVYEPVTKTLGPGGEFDVTTEQLQLKDFKSLLQGDFPQEIKDILEKTTSDAISNYQNYEKSSLEKYNPEKEGFKTKKGEDTLKYPGGEVEFYPQDTIMSFTKGPETVNSLKEIGSLINDLDSNKNVLSEVGIQSNQFDTLLGYMSNMSRVNQGSNDMQTQKVNFGNELESIKSQKIELKEINNKIDKSESTTQTVEGGISIDLNVNVTGNGDTDQISKMINDPIVLEKLKQKIQNLDFGFANTNMAGSYRNIQRL
jgi:hypothetical protein